MTKYLFRKFRNFNIKYLVTCDEVKLFKYNLKAIDSRHLIIQSNKTPTKTWKKYIPTLILKYRLFFIRYKNNTQLRRKKKNQTNHRQHRPIQVGYRVVSIDPDTLAHQAPYSTLYETISQRSLVYNLAGCPNSFVAMYTTTPITRKLIRFIQWLV